MNALRRNDITLKTSLFCHIFLKLLSISRLKSLFNSRKNNNNKKKTVENFQWMNDNTIKFHELIFQMPLDLYQKIRKKLLGF